MNMGRNTRETWIDIARLLCMLIIIIGHTPCYEKTILEYLTTFHVSIFFILSGYLYHPQKFGIEFKKSFVSLIIPYIILGIVNCIYWSFIDWHTDGLPMINQARTYTTQLLMTHIGLPMVGPLWFLIVLFLLRIGMVFFKSPKTLIPICVVCAFTAYFIEQNYHDFQLYAPTNIFLALPFFTCGYLMQSTQKNWAHKALNAPKHTRLGLAILFLILSIVLFWYQGGNNMSMHDYGKNIVTFYICAIFGSLPIIFLSSLFQINNQTVLYCLQTANNGLPLMIGLQITLIHFIKMSIKVYAYHITGSIVLSLVIMAITYFLTLLSMKYFPIIIGKRQ